MQNEQARALQEQGEGGKHFSWASYLIKKMNRKKGTFPEEQGQDSRLYGRGQVHSLEHGAPDLRPDYKRRRRACRNEKGKILKDVHIVPNAKEILPPRQRKPHADKDTVAPRGNSSRFRKGGRAIEKEYRATKKDLNLL